MAKFKLAAIRSSVKPLQGSFVRPLTTETQRITGSKLQTIRARVLRRAKGFCECDVCRAPGAVPQIAEVVDHRIPLWEGGDDDPHDDSNRQALSIEHHAEKTAAEAARRAQAGR